MQIIIININTKKKFLDSFNIIKKKKKKHKKKTYKKKKKK